MVDDDTMMALETGGTAKLKTLGRAFNYNFWGQGQPTELYNGAAQSLKATALLAKAEGCTKF